MDGIIKEFLFIFCLHDSSGEKKEVAGRSRETVILCSRYAAVVLEDAVAPTPAAAATDSDDAVDSEDAVAAVAATAVDSEDAEALVKRIT